MTIEKKKTLLTKLFQLIDEIPTPPPGRKMALCKTNLEQARLWLVDDIKDDMIHQDIQKPTENKGKYNIATGNSTLNAHQEINKK